MGRGKSCHGSCRCPCCLLLAACCRCCCCCCCCCCSSSCCPRSCCCTSSKYRSNSRHRGIVGYNQNGSTSCCLNESAVVLTFMLFFVCFRAKCAQFSPPRLTSQDQPKTSSRLVHDQLSPSHLCHDGVWRACSVAACCWRWCDC